MNKPPLGVIRISAAGAIFEAPYFDEADFPRTVVVIRAHQGFEPPGAGVFVPYHAIDWVVKVPEGTDRAQHEARGETRQ